MAIHSDQKPPPCPARPPPLLFSPAEMRVSTKRLPPHQRQSESILTLPRVPSNSRSLAEHRFSGSAIDHQASPIKQDAPELLQPNPRPRYYRRSIGVLPITQSNSPNSPKLSPKTSIQPVQHLPATIQAQSATDSRFSLRSPLTLKTPINLVDPNPSSPLGHGSGTCDASGTTLASHQSCSIPAKRSPIPVNAQSLLAEDLTPRSSGISSASSHTEISSGTPKGNFSSSPKLFSLLSSPAYRSKNPDGVRPRVKSGFFSVMNKSEPNLSSRPGFKDIPPLMSSIGPEDLKAHNEETHTCSSRLLSAQSVSSPIAQLGSPSSNSADTPRQATSPNTQQQKMKSIINNTSKRISIFTSRLNHSTAVSRSGSSLNGSPMAPAGDTRSNRSPILISSLITSADIGDPIPMPDHPINDNLLTASPLTSNASDGSTSKKSVQSNSSRIHSPGFYRSLKMRWKPHSSPQAPPPELPPSPSLCISPSMDENKSQTFSNYEQLKRSQKKALWASDEPVSTEPSLPQRHSRLTLTEFLTSRNTKKKCPGDEMETMDTREEEGERTSSSGPKKMTPRPAQTHTTMRPRAASTSSTISNSVSSNLASFVRDPPEPQRRFSQLKPLQLQAITARTRPRSGTQTIPNPRNGQNLSSEAALHPEINMARSALTLTTSLDSISDHLPDNVTGRLNMDHTPESRRTSRSIALGTNPAVISESTNDVMNKIQAKSSEVVKRQYFIHSSIISVKRLDFDYSFALMFRVGSASFRPSEIWFSKI